MKTEVAVIGNSYNNVTIYLAASMIAAAIVFKDELREITKGVFSSKDNLSGNNLKDLALRDINSIESEVCEDFIKRIDAVKSRLKDYKLFYKDSEIMGERKNENALVNDPVSEKVKSDLILRLEAAAACFAASSEITVIEEDCPPQNESHQDQLTLFNQNLSKAEAGDATALVDAVLFLQNQNSSVSSEDKQKLFTLCSQKAAEGNVSAMNLVGLLYDFGAGTCRDMKKALEFYRKAAAHGSVHALYNLGACYLIGEEVVRDRKTAIEFYKQAAALDFIPAMEELVYLYQQDKVADPEQENYWRQKLLSTSLLQSPVAVVRK